MPLPERTTFLSRPCIAGASTPEKRKGPASSDILQELRRQNGPLPDRFVPSPKMRYGENAFSRAPVRDGSKVDPFVTYGDDMPTALASPGREWFGNIGGDIRGGVVVALGLIAEALAFSFMAGVDPVVGLYTTACLAMTLAFFGGRTAMISAASGSTALIMILMVRAHGVEYVTITTLMAGAIQIIGGFFRVDKLIQFVSYPVIMGFVNALAILIFLAQVPQLLHADLYDYAMIAAGLAIIYLLPYVTRIVPSPVVCIVVLTAFAIWSGLPFQTVGDMGRLPTGLPMPLRLTLPSPDMWAAVFPYALGIAIVGLIESLLTSTVVDDLTATPGNKSRECKGQGIGNIVSGLLGGMTGCGIIDQTKINVRFGGRGRLSTFLAGALLLFMVIALHRWVAAIPSPALVAVMIFAAVTTFNWTSLRALRTDPPASAAIMIITVLVVLVTDNLAYGVLTGVCLNSLIFVNQINRTLRIDSTLEPDGARRVYSVAGHVFFASDDTFISAFDYGEDIKNITIDLGAAHFWDVTSVNTLERALNKLRQAGKNVVLTRAEGAFDKLAAHHHHTPARAAKLLREFGRREDGEFTGRSKL